MIIDAVKICKAPNLTRAIVCIHTMISIAILNGSVMAAVMLPGFHAFDAIAEMM